MPPPRPRAPILVVDDQPEVREALQALFQCEGFATAAVEDAKAALAYLRGGGPACLIVLDLRMPGMTGWQLWDVLQANDALAAIPVVVYSAATESAPPKGIAGYIRKPGNPVTLLALAEQHSRPDAP